MSDNIHCNLRKWKCNKEKKPKIFLKNKIFTTEIERMGKVKTKAISLIRRATKPSQNHSEPI
jgi:hypothetical protein